MFEIVEDFEIVLAYSFIELRLIKFRLHKKRNFVYGKLSNFLLTSIYGNF
jgi:hypothetical protein